jgi:hypothetical protein
MQRLKHFWEILMSLQLQRIGMLRFSIISNQFFRDGGGILYMFTGLQNDDWVALFVLSTED